MSDRPNPPVTDDIGTPAPPVSINQMTEAEYRRLINHFLWLVMDEAEPLREFGQPEEVLPRDLDHRSWGPWPQADCAAILLRWFDAGLLALYNAAGALPPRETRELLTAQQPWPDLLSHPSEPCLAATKEGAKRTDEEWYDVVKDLPDRG